MSFAGEMHFPQIGLIEMHADVADLYVDIRWDSNFSGSFFKVLIQAPPDFDILCPALPEPLGGAFHLRDLRVF